MSRVNIIIPVFNAAEYLSELLDSVFGQTITDYRVIIINDCSTDISEEIILTYIEKYGDRIVYKKNEHNMKQGPTRNVGLEVSEANNSDYTAFLDADDWIEPDFLECMLTNAEQSHADVVICGIERFENGNGKIICTEAIDGVDIDLLNGDGMYQLAYINPAPYNKLYRTECIQGYRFRELKRSEDTCYFFEILQSVKKISYTNNRLYHYRVREDSLTGNIGYDTCISMENGFRDLLLRLDYPNNTTREEIETQIFIRVACGGVCRASFSNFAMAQNYIKETKAYMDEVIPNWRNNKYLKFGKIYGKKPLLLKILAMLYKNNLFLLFVYCYYFMLKVLKKDIRT